MQQGGHLPAASQVDGTRIERLYQVDIFCSRLVRSKMRWKPDGQYGARSTTLAAACKKGKSTQG